MALDELLDEHEQGEKVRTWLKENALGLVGGLVLGLALIGGGKWWTQRQHEARVALGEAYDQVVRAIEAGDLEQASREAGDLAGTAYAPLLALALAKGQLEAGDRDAAIDTLRAASSDDPGLAAIIRHRLARLLVDAGQAEEALSLLAGADDPGALETRGDAHFAHGRGEQARTECDRRCAGDVAAPQRSSNSNWARSAARRARRGLNPDEAVHPSVRSRAAGGGASPVAWSWCSPAPPCWPAAAPSAAGSAGTGKEGRQARQRANRAGDLTPSVSVTRIWSASVRARTGWACQAPAIADGRVYAAAVDGGVRALDLQTGAVLWHYRSTCG